MRNTYCPAGFYASLIQNPLTKKTTVAVKKWLSTHNHPVGPHLDGMYAEKRKIESEETISIVTKMVKVGSPFVSIKKFILNNASKYNLYVSFCVGQSNKA
jgi:hypothetical protein